MPTAPSHLPDSIRIDKWLWAVRIYKTRSLATEACRSGRVKIAGQTVKPSRDIHAGDEITIHLGVYSKTVRVILPLHLRVSAALVPQYMEDLTTDKEYEKLKIQQDMKPEYRPRGLGRPTKKQRRLIDRIKKTKDFSK